MRVDGRKDMTKLIAAFHNVVNARKTNKKARVSPAEHLDEQWHSVLVHKYRGIAHLCKKQLHRREEGNTYWTEASRLNRQFCWSQHTRDNWSSCLSECALAIVWRSMLPQECATNGKTESREYKKHYYLKLPASHSYDLPHVLAFHTTANTKTDRHTQNYNFTSTSVQAWNRPSLQE